MSRIPLEHWKAQTPPDDFVDRVDRALDAEAARAANASPRLGRRGLVIGLSAVAAAAGVGAFWGGYSATRTAIRGVLRARERTEVRVSQGVVAVAEQGASLRYADGHIEQLEGEVSYRAEPSAELHVRTPLGEASGKGACCRIKVVAAPDASLETEGPSMLVAVTTGELSLRHGRNDEKLSANRYALASGGRIRTDADDDSGAIARSLSLPPRPAPTPTASQAASQPAPAPSQSASAAPKQRPPSRPAPSASVSAPEPPARPPASARPVITPGCICVPGDSLCACPE